MKKRDNKWFVLITRPKFEKKVATQLNLLGIKSYCPVRTEFRQWSDRKKKVEVPLLPSMILVNIDEAERPNVFTVLGVKRYFYWLGKPAIVTTEEISILKMVEEQRYSSISVEQLQPGSVIDLKAFGMQAEKGTVKYVSGNQCWVVLHSLGYVIKLKLAKAKTVKEYS